MHARETIRNAFVTTLTGLTTTGANVGDSRVYPWKTLPALNVTTNSESLIEYVLGGGQTRELEVVIEGRAKAASNVDNVLDTMSEEVETAIAADKTLGIGIKQTVISSTEMEIGGDSNQLVGITSLTYSVTYRVDESDPSTIIS